jgi:hypothetical protein
MYAKRRLDRFQVNLPTCVGVNAKSDLIAEELESSWIWVNGSGSAGHCNIRVGFIVNGVPVGDESTPEREKCCRFLIELKGTRNYSSCVERIKINRN